MSRGEECRDWSVEGNPNLPSLAPSHSTLISLHSSRLSSFDLRPLLFTRHSTLLVPSSLDTYHSRLDTVSSSRQAITKQRKDSQSLWVNSPAACCLFISSPYRSPSFPNASIGNPGETGTGPPIKTFGGDDSGMGKIRRGDLMTCPISSFRLIG